MKNKKLEIAAIILIFIVLALVYTFPLVSHFNRGIPYGHFSPKGGEVVSLTQGDHLQSYYYFWLLKDSLRGEHSFFFNPYEFSVEGEKLFTLRRIPLSVLFLLFSVFGNIFAYNALVILSVVTAGVAMFLLARIYTENRAAAFAAALIYALCPFARAQLLGGHPNGFLFGLLPLIIYSYEMIFREGKLRYAFIAGIAILFPACMEKHLLYYIFIFSGIYIPLRIILSPSKKYIRALFILAVLFLISLGITFYMKKMNLDVSIAGAGRKLSEVKAYSPALKDIVRRTNPNSEKYIYLGIIPVILGVWGAFSRIFFKYSFRQKVIPIFYVFTFLFSYILCLGTRLNNIFPLYKLCYKFVPYFKYPRVPGRMVIVSFLALCILAAYGIKELQKRKLRFVTLLIPLLFLGIAIDYFPYRLAGVSLLDKENPVYATVKESIGEEKILELPIWPGDSSWASIYLYYITQTHARIINGYHPMVSRKYVKEIFYPLLTLNIGEIDGEQYELLKRLNVKYVIFHQEAFPPKVSHYPSLCSVQRLKASRYLELVQQSGPIWLFRLLEKPLTEERVRLSRPLTGVLKEGERFYHWTGRATPDAFAGNGKAAFAEAGKDKKGYLIGGRQQVFPKGDYRVTFRLKAKRTPEGKPVARINILGRRPTGEKKTLIDKELHNKDFPSPDTYQDINFSYFLEKPQRAEFMLYFTGAADLWCDYVYILCGGEKDPRFRYAAEQLYYRGEVVKDSQARGGQAVLFDGKEENIFIYGPYRRYPAGRYEVAFLLKTDDVSCGEAAVLDVAASYGKEIIASKVLKGSDFEEEGRYRRFKLPFSLDKERILEFRVLSCGGISLWVDEIVINQK